MRPLFNLLLYVAIFCCVLSSCREDGDPPAEPLPDHLYLGGNLIDGNGKLIASYWEGSSANSYKIAGGSKLTSLFVADDNVYATVLEFEHVANGGISPFGVCWINGETKVMLDDAQHTSSVSSIRVNNGSVYVMGENNQSGITMRYWKDDQYHAVDGGGMGFQTTGFHVENNNAFITGIQYSGFSEVVVKSFYSKNETLVALTEDEAIANDYSNSIFVLNDIVYVAGYENGGTSGLAAKYWMNEEPILLSEGSNALAADIFVEGEDIHIIGNHINNTSTINPVYWKNNVMVELPVPDTLGRTEATSLFVKNGDVYIAGTFTSGLTSRGVYWINGVLKQIKSKWNFELTEIFVTE